MLAITLDQVRVFLHVLAATIWVGGQLTLGALVPALRGYEGVTKVAANRFAMVSWPAFGVLLLTGIWNMQATDFSGPAQMTLNVKLAFVVLSGLSAILHTQAKSKKGLAIWGALGLVSALVATFFGVQLG